VFVVWLDSGDIDVAPDLTSAAWAVEEPDLAEAELVDATGQVYKLVVREGRPEGAQAPLATTPIGVPSRQDLERRLQRYAAARSLHVPGADDYVIAVANVIAKEQWELSFPRWPRWLHHRIHGVTPPTFTVD
jgi:hypothetical protein